MRQAGQKVLPKKTGMEPKAARLTSIPVEMQFPVLGQRIMTMPIVLFGTAASSSPGGKNVRGSVSLAGGVSCYAARSLFRCNLPLI
jgi:hypothetical protein